MVRKSEEVFTNLFYINYTIFSQVLKCSTCYLESTGQPKVRSVGPRNTMKL